MKAKLFCHQCKQEYEVLLENIKFMQKHKNFSLSFIDETYHFKEECFFKTLNLLKREEMARNQINE